MRRTPFQDELKHMYGVVNRPWVFFIGLAIAGVAGNLAYDFAGGLSSTVKAMPAWGFQLAFIGLGLLSARLVNRYYDRRLRIEVYREPRIRRPKPEEALRHSYRGVIWLLSPDPNSLEIARYAIGKHKQGLGNENTMQGNLEVCWCIYGAEKSMFQIFSKIS